MNQVIEMKSAASPSDVIQNIYAQAAKYGIDVHSVSSNTTIDGHHYLISVAHDDHQKFRSLLDAIGGADIYDTISVDRKKVNAIFNKYINMSRQYGAGVVNEVLRLAIGCYDCCDAFHQSDDADVIMEMAFRYGTEDEMDVTQALRLVEAAASVDGIDAIIKSADAKNIRIKRDDNDSVAMYLIGEAPSLEPDELPEEYKCSIKTEKPVEPTEKRNQPYDWQKEPDSDTDASENEKCCCGGKCEKSEDTDEGAAITAEDLGGVLGEILLDALKDAGGTVIPMPPHVAKNLGIHLERCHKPGHGTVRVGMIML